MPARKTALAREPRITKFYQKPRVKAFLIPTEPPRECTPYSAAVQEKTSRDMLCVALQGAIARAENATFNPS